MARLRDLYKSKIVAELTKEFGYGNVMAVPKMEKVVVSMGVGKACVDKKFLEMAKKDLTLICGQKPLVCNARKSVSNFKVREGQATGLKTTLRGVRNVRVHGSSDQPGDPASSRLPRAEPERVRRARQLLDGAWRTERVPRDQPGRRSRPSRA